MEIHDMSNEELFRYYACHLKQIDNDYKIKKDFEEEIKARFNTGGLNNGLSGSN